MLLQELEPSLRPYLAQCKTISHGRTHAWDLASLLIKPVQRCLKYPLLLDQILAVTPLNHPDRANLQRANDQVLLVAEHINEVKKRQDIVGKVIIKSNRGSSSGQRDVTHSRSFSSATSSNSGSFGQSVTKKFLRSSQRAREAVGLSEPTNDTEFDTLTALVNTSRSAVLRFASEMTEWSKTTKTALETQLVMVQGWKQVYAPMADEVVEHSGYQRLGAFITDVLEPTLQESWPALVGLLFQFNPALQD